MDIIKRLVQGKPAVIFSKNLCCMSHSIKQLISGYGVNPTVYDLDNLTNGREIDQALQKLGWKPGVPALFIGQKFIEGANDKVAETILQLQNIF